MASANPIDFTLPADKYTATLSDNASNYKTSLRLRSSSAPNPVTGKPGIPTGYGFLCHPNEITKQSARDQRSAAGKSNGPFNSPQSLGCIIFKNKEEYDAMSKVLSQNGYRIGDMLPLELKDAN